MKHNEKQYHIGLAAGEVAPFIVMCGDPARVEKIASRFDHTSKPVGHREYLSFTGTYRGVPMTAMAVGMGPGSTEIACVELCQILEHPTMLRIGSCGALQKNINIGDVVISSGAMRMEKASSAYVAESFPAVAHHEVVLALLAAAHEKTVPHHLGITATAAGFYGAQGREVPGFSPRHPEIVDDLARMNVLNFEMEMSCLLTLATYRGFRAGGVCAVYAQRQENRFVDPAEMRQAEARAIDVGLEALVKLHAMDARRGNQAHWLPHMGG